MANSSHSHSLTHDHTMASSAPVPPYYELLFLKNISASIMPAGAVTAWAQEDAPPAGWSLCAGQDGVPDLRGRFLRSTGWGEDSGETGGSSSHDHTGASDTVDTVGSWGSNYQTVGCSGPSATDGSHSHSFQHDHAVDSSEHLPPYRNVDFLLADDNEAPQSGQIALWDEDLGSVPVGWAVCDGTNGTPDLQDRFPRGTPEGEIVGVLGGSLDHDHGSSSDPGGTTGMSGGGNGNCSDGGPYMAFHDHEANAHGHPPTLSAGHEPAATTLHFIMKL